MKDLILGAIAVIVLVIGLFYVATQGLEKQDKVNCLELQEQAKEFSGFWITEHQDELCRSLGIKIIAPVK